MRGKTYELRLVYIPGETQDIDGDAAVLNFTLEYVADPCLDTKFLVDQFDFPEI